jgi:hypothetical protein
VGAIVGVRVVNGAVGELVIRLGLDDGGPVGSKVGVRVGTLVGSSEGTPVGSKVGVDVGVVVGSPEGTPVGFRVGDAVGSFVGVRVGVAVGSSEGTLVGLKVGDAVSILVGSSDGLRVGLLVGSKKPISSLRPMPCSKETYADCDLRSEEKVGLESMTLHPRICEAGLPPQSEYHSFDNLPGATLSMFFFTLLSSAEVSAVNASVTETSRRKDRRVEFIIFVDKRYGSVEQICRLWISRCVCRFYRCSIMSPAIGFDLKYDILVDLLYSRLREFL